MGSPQQNVQDSPKRGNNENHARYDTCSKINQSYVYRLADDSTILCRSCSQSGEGYDNVS